MPREYLVCDYCQRHGEQSWVCRFCQTPWYPHECQQSSQQTKDTLPSPTDKEALEKALAAEDYEEARRVVQRMEKAMQEEQAKPEAMGELAVRLKKAEGAHKRAAEAAVAAEKKMKKAKEDLLEAAMLVDSLRSELHAQSAPANEAEPVKDWSCASNGADDPWAQAAGGDAAVADQDWRWEPMADVEKPAGLHCDSVEPDTSNGAGTPAPPADLGLPSGLHYDFIEAGTSDWGTVTQSCTEDRDWASCLAAYIRTSADSLRDARGLAVEPVSEHLDNLPSPPRVQKVAAALDEHSSTSTLHCVSGVNVDRHIGQYWTEYPAGGREVVDVMWYAKSLSAIGEPHPDLKAMLDSVERPDLMEVREVPVLSWTDLCSRYSVGSVDVVQLDCEGKDCAIIRGMVAYCTRNPDAWPRVLCFEANRLTPWDEIEETLDTLQRHGYTIRFRSSCNCAVVRG